MCGILGWISPSLTDPKRSVQEAQPALQALRPRGPDGNGIETGKGWLLGHTRLAILDLTEKARQPMTEGQGGWLVYNGEIYNFKELREELIGLGYRFQSSGDTEVLLYAMREWGVSCLERLRGMFAFGWLDTKKQELILTRDRYGVKPLAYELRNNELRFASDLHALRLLPGASREIDSESAYLYMALGYVPSPHSILKGVKKLRPAYYLRVRWSEKGIRDVEERAYWSIKQISAGEEIGCRNGNAFLDEYENRVKESIRYRLTSDVPVGVLLSGGIDSTLITAFCRETANGKVPSFTLGFEDPKNDEAPFARAIAQQLGGQHREFYIRKENVLDTWKKLWEVYDEPFADSSAVPTVALSRLVARYVKVALTGDGGDEVFAGYPWHRALDRVSRVSAMPQFFHRAVTEIAPYFSPSFRYQADIFNQEDRITQWSVLRTGLTDSRAELLPVEGAGERSHLSHYFREWAKDLETIVHPLEWACRMDLLTYLPDNLMVKSDRASMSTGLELREPLLDHQLTAWCLMLPMRSRYDSQRRRGKILPRRILEQKIPSRLLNRHKQGFTPPLGEWLQGPLRPVVNETFKQLEQGDLSPLCLPAECRDWSECAKTLNDLHQQFLWRIVCFSEWLRHHRSLSSQTC